MFISYFTMKYSYNMQQWNSKLHLYFMFSAMVGIGLYLFAFFPVKQSLAGVDQSMKSSNNGSELHRINQPVIGRLVFMVVDALRSDFVMNAEAATNMPFLTSLVKKGLACTYTATASPPTVTMPRVKAMVTGTVPGFVDIILNLGSARIVEDSFVSHLIAAGNKAVFYGDDTWLKLFPDTFVRSEGTTSFFVADYTEVDVNVTRHLSTELNQEDWTLMILHYLGLDHIGHLVGPRSSLVPPKLQEMDSIAQQIHQTNPKERLPQVLVICGDHGMKDSGGHGGSSQAETHVAVVVVGLPCTPSKEKISQVDLAPTLSVLLGQPIPKSSVGNLVPELLLSLSKKDRLDALHKNTAHLAALLGTSITSKQESLLVEARKLYSEWQTNPISDLFERTTALYESVSIEMSADLASAHSSFDLYGLAVSLSLIIQCLVTLALYVRHDTVPAIENSKCLLLWLFYFGLNSFLCVITCRGNSLVCQVHLQGILLQICLASVLAFNTYILWSFIRTCAPYKLPICPAEKFLLIGTFLQCMGLAASSLVEEEHQVWYFLWTTLLFILLYKTNVLLVITCLVLHGIACKLNQTGDKWANQPDIEDWLAERKHYTTLVFTSALVTIGLYLYKSNRKKSILTKLNFLIALVLIYFYRAAVEGVDIPFLKTLLSHQGLLEARLFGFCLALILTSGLLRARSSQDAVSLLRDCWILGAAMLRRPHDVILISVQLLASHTISKTLHSRTMALTIAHIWLGWVAYFCQGNSNSLASIDVAAGYVGLSDYQPVIVGLFLLAHTFSASVLSQLLLVSELVKTSSGNKYPYVSISVPEVLKGLKIYSTLRLLPVCFYLLIMIIQREHLFIWSVFAPKLLYEATSTLVSFLTLIMCQLCFLYGPS